MPSAPRGLLFELVRGPDATVSAYVGRSSVARSLIYDLARSDLSDDDLAAVRRTLEERLAARGAGHVPTAPATAPPVRLAPLLAPSRILLAVSCASVGDVIDLSLSRLDSLSSALPAGKLVDDAHQSLVALGAGVVTARCVAAGLPSSAALVTTRDPIIDPSGPILVVLVVQSGARGL